MPPKTCHPLKTILSSKKWKLYKKDKKDKKDTGIELGTVSIDCQEIEEEQRAFLGVFYQVHIWLSGKKTHDEDKKFIRFVTKEEKFQEKPKYWISDLEGIKSEEDKITTSIYDQYYIQLY